MLVAAKSWFKSFRADRRGGTIAIFAFSAVPLALSIGLSVDYARLSSERQSMQTALDLTLVAAAKYKSMGLQDWQAKSQEMLVRNLPRTPAVTASFTSIGSAVSGTVSRNAPLAMGGLFGRGTVPITVSAAASVGDLPPDLCVLTLRSIAFSGPVQFNTNCGIQANTSIAMSGSGRINAPSTRAAGSITTPNPANINTPGRAYMPAVPDPMATMPEPIPSGPCANIIQAGNAPLNLPPQRYCTFVIAGSPVITLQPGIHVFESTVSIAGSATIQGTDVMLYFKNGASAAFAGLGRLDVSATTTGPYAGTVIFMSRNDSGALALSGDTALNLNGLVYAPTSPLAMSGGSTTNVMASNVAMIVENIAVSGSGNFNMQRPNGRCGPSSFLPAAMMALCQGGDAPIRMVK
jgi:hypothetical protein